MTSGLSQIKYNPPCLDAAEYYLFRSNQRDRLTHPSLQVRGVTVFMRRFVLDAASKIRHLFLHYLGAAPKRDNIHAGLII